MRIPGKLRFDMELAFGVGQAAGGSSAPPAAPS